MKERRFTGRLVKDTNHSWNPEREVEVKAEGTRRAAGAFTRSISQPWGPERGKQERREVDEVIASQRAGDHQDSLSDNERKEKKEKGESKFMIKLQEAVGEFTTWRWSMVKLIKRTEGLSEERVKALETTLGLENNVAYNKQVAWILEDIQPVMKNFTQTYGKIIKIVEEIKERNKADELGMIRGRIPEASYYIAAIDRARHVKEWLIEEVERIME